ncbi:hypothetical protein ACED35_16880, partial [Enterovibrio norvegicus]
HNPTRSNDPQATSVSPLAHESSPKNDSSLEQRKRDRDLRIIARLREIHSLPEKVKKGKNEYKKLHYVCTYQGCFERR